MDIFESASEYLRAENEDFDSEPSNISISTVDYDKDVDYEVNGRFPNEPTPDGYVLPHQRRVVVDVTSTLNNKISSMFSMVRENVKVQNATIHSISLSRTSEADDSFDSWPYYTSESADARVFIGIGREKIPADVKDELMGLLLDEIHKLDESVSEDDVRNIEYLFDDMKRNFNHCLRGELQTQHPYRYYSNVTSTEEYIKKLVDDTDEKAKLEEQNEYKVSFFESMFVDSEEIDDGANTVPPMYIREQAEAIMEEFVEDTLDTEWETMLEAESISFGDFDYDGYNGQDMNYWIYVPITDGELGVSR